MDARGNDLIISKFFKFYGVCWHSLTVRLVVQQTTLTVIWQLECFIRLFFFKWLQGL